jgi:hypothetical protein
LAPGAATAGQVQPLIAVKSLTDDASTLLVGFGPAPPAGWSVRRMTLTADVWTRASFYVSPFPPADEQPLDDYRVTGSYAADDDEYDANQPIFIPEGHHFLVYWWTGATRMLVRIEYVEGAL